MIDELCFVFINGNDFLPYFVRALVCALQQRDPIQPVRRNSLRTPAVVLVLRLPPPSQPRRVRRMRKLQQRKVQRSRQQNQTRPRRNLRTSRKRRKMHQLQRSYPANQLIPNMIETFNLHRQRRLLWRVRCLCVLYFQLALDNQLTVFFSHNCSSIFQLADTSTDDVDAGPSVASNKDDESSLDRRQNLESSGPESKSTGSEASKKTKKRKKSVDHNDCTKKRSKIEPSEANGTFSCCELVVVYY